MASKRIVAINEEIQKELSNLIRNLKDPLGAGHYDLHHPCGDHSRPALG